MLYGTVCDVPETEVSEKSVSEKSVAEPSEKPRILALCSSRREAEEMLCGVAESSQLVVVPTPMRALARLRSGQFNALYVASQHLEQALDLGRLLQNKQVLEGMPDGVVLLDSDNSILWSNGRLADWTGREDVAGENFYTVLGSPEILGPDFCPFHTALATGVSTSSTLRTSENRYFQVHAAPVHEADGLPHHLIINVRDVTTEMLQQQKLEAIHQAGMELADLTAEELFHMTVEERIELLKSNILHCTKDLLHFDQVEIRLLDAKTNHLEPLLVVGMEPEAVDRVLLAQPQNNGVTGFVAATGKSYLCEDTTEDPLYIEGSRGAKSSLTVPLVLHDEVIGTFNVESPEARAFSESDLQFLEIFTREVAAALNTLELLVAEKASAAVESVELIHSAVALPVDHILNDAIDLMEHYIGHKDGVIEPLQRILRNARDIKQMIHKVGQKMAPAHAYPVTAAVEDRPGLRGRRVLVVDADEGVRVAAQNLLWRYGCIVETVERSESAVSMVRNMMGEGGYDCIISDIRLGSTTGCELMRQLQKIVDPVPLILMTGFGYDPGHTLIKAKQLGPLGILYKPFRVDQLIAAVEAVIESVPGPVGT